MGRLDSISTFLPDTSLFLYMYVRKEAVLSSMIEGTQSSISDLLLFELDQEPGVPLNDVREVSNYVAALDYGLRRLREGFPLSLLLLKEIHGVLLNKGRGSQQNPGEFRRSQNWIGGTRPGNAYFVPPPGAKVIECMGKLELFLHDQPEPTPVLLKAALAHVQFEMTWLDFFAEAALVGLRPSTLKVHRAMMERPITTSGWLVEKTGIPPATVNKALAHLEKLDIVTELTARKRNRLFSSAAFISKVSKISKRTERNQK